MDNYKAKPEYWKILEDYSTESRPYSCILELRSRVEALEAQKSETDSITDYYSLLAAQSKGKAVFHGPSDSREVVKPAPVAGGLVERVADAITSETGSRWATTEARAAILEVVRWLQQQGWQAAGEWLEVEAG